MHATTNITTTPCNVSAYRSVLQYNANESIEPRYDLQYY